MNLTDECILALKNDLKILDNNEKERIVDDFFHNIKLKFGKFDWDYINCLKKINNIKFNDIKKYIKRTRYYIIWSDPTEPVLLSHIDNILENIYDITAVSTNTWLISEDKKYYIEIYHEKEISIAIFE